MPSLWETGVTGTQCFTMLGLVCVMWVTLGSVGAAPLPPMLLS